LSIEQAKSQVIAYLKEQFNKEKQVYPSDVADALSLDYDVVRQVFDAVEETGMVQKA
jgi:hypothetical protein